MMESWNFLAKLADVLQIAIAAITLVLFLARIVRYLPKDRVRYFMRQLHDPTFVALLVICQILASVQMLTIPPLIAIGITVVVIPLPMLITLWYIRKPIEISKKLRALALAPILALAYYINVLILVCTVSIAFNQSAPNIFAYLTLPNQVAHMLPELFAWALTVSIILPVMWVVFVPRVKASTYSDILRRLSR